MKTVAVLVLFAAGSLLTALVPNTAGVLLGAVVCASAVALSVALKA